MNKKISFPIAIIIIVVCAVLVGAVVWQYGLLSGIGPKSFSPKEVITILYPNGGEVWREGETYTIRWKAKGVDKITIGFLDYTGAPGSKGPWGYGFTTDISANQGEYSWTVPTHLIPGDKYKIWIADSETRKKLDESDDYFTVTEK